MSDATLVILLKFALALFLGLSALVLIVAGVRAFFRGTGIHQLKDHTFEISGADFKLNAVVSSAGAIMLIMGSIFGYFSFSSAPAYEANLLQGSVKVSRLEPAIPRLGSEVLTAAGDRVVIDNFQSTIAIPPKWTPQDTVGLTAALAGPRAEDLLSQFARCADRNPTAKIVVDYGGGYLRPNIAANSVMDTWVAAFRNAGVEPGRVVFVPPSPSSASGLEIAPTISFANGESKCTPMMK